MENNDSTASSRTIALTSVSQTDVVMDDSSSPINGHEDMTDEEKAELKRLLAKGRKRNAGK
jgi:hypothetical protein